MLFDSYHCHWFSVDISPPYLFTVTRGGIHLYRCSKLDLVKYQFPMFSLLLKRMSELDVKGIFLIIVTINGTKRDRKFLRVTV